MKNGSKYLESIIDDLNYLTLIEQPWVVEYIDRNGVHRIIGNSRKRMQDGIWVATLDKKIGEFPIIRDELGIALCILSCSSIKD